MPRVRRPLALLGGAAFAALAAAAAMGADLAGKLAVFCAAMGLCALLTGYLCHRKNELPAHAEPSVRRGPGAFSVSCLCRRLAPFGAALLCAALFLGLYVWRWHASVAPVTAELTGVKARISGVLLEYPTESRGRAYYTVRVEHVSVEGEAKDLPVFTARISSAVPFGCKPCDGIEGTVKFFSYSDAGGLYSTRNSRLADGVVLGAYFTDYGTVETAPAAGLPARRLTADLRRLLGRNFEKRLPARESGMIRTILLGERDLVSDRDYGNFKAVGASHLMVISGLHLAALAGFFSLALGKLFRSRLLRNLLVAALVVGFLAVIGFPPAASRSGIMFLLYLAADCLGRESDGVNSLGAAVLLLCLKNPFFGGDLGLTLSVLATLGILLLGRPLTERLLRPVCERPRLERALRPAASVFAMTCSALLFTLPVQVLVFRGLPLIAPLASLVLIFPCQLLLYVSMDAALLGLAPVLAPVAAPVFLCAGWLARAALWLAEQLAKLPCVYLDFSQPVILCLTALLLLMAAVLALGRSRAAVCVFLAGAVVLCGCGAVLVRLPRREAVTFAAAPDSSAVVVMQGDRAAVLSTGGFQSDAARMLLKRNNIRRVEAVFLPVRDLKAREGAEEVLAAYGVDTLVLPEGASLHGSLKKTAGGGTEERSLKDGEPMEILDGVTVTSREGMKVLTVEWNGRRTAIETADAGEGVCDLLFTVLNHTNLSSGFTVVQNDAIMEERELSALENFAPGRYLLPDGDGLFIDLFPDGTVTLRGESACLN